MKKLGIVFGAILMMASVNELRAQNPSEVNKKTPELPGEIVVDLGFNSWINGPDNRQDTLDINWWRSKSLGIYFKKPFDLSKKLAFVPGVGVSFEKFGTKYPYKIGFEIDEDTGNRFLGYDSIPGIDIKKNKIAINSIEFPVEFRYYFTGDTKGKGLYLAAGGSVAFRIESHTKVKYTDQYGNKRQIKERDNFELNSMRLGAYGRIGWRSVSLFYKHYMTNVFNENGPYGTENMKYSTIGISLSGL